MPVAADARANPSSAPNLSRSNLVRWLEQRLSDPSARAEWQRHEKVVDCIVKLKAETAARAIKIVLPEGVSSTEIPAGVSFQPDS
jgi:hypothetical protein